MEGRGEDGGEGKMEEGVGDKREGDGGVGVGGNMGNNNENNNKYYYYYYYYYYFHFYYYYSTCFFKLVSLSRACVSNESLDACVIIIIIII